MCNMLHIHVTYNKPDSGVVGLSDVVTKTDPFVVAVIV